MKLSYILIAASALTLLSACSEPAEAEATNLANSAEPNLMQQGKARAMSCAACHGPVGISRNPTYPSLAGRPQAELASLLQAYRSGEKTNPLMSPQAQALSDADVELLANYYSALPAE